MGLTALVMAGGAATRMKTAKEKPLLEIENRAMLLWVLDALRKSKSIDRIVVATSARTTQTARVAQENGVEVVETPGEGYVPGMRYAIRKLGLKDTVVVSADLPFLTTKLVDQAITKFLSSGKPALAAMAPVNAFQTLDVKPQHIFQIDGKDLAPIGFNIIRGSRINELTLEEEVLIVESPEFILNVNTQGEYGLAKKIFQESRRRVANS